MQKLICTNKKIYNDIRWALSFENVTTVKVFWKCYHGLLISGKASKAVAGKHEDITRYCIILFLYISYIILWKYIFSISYYNYIYYILYISYFKGPHVELPGKISRHKCGPDNQLVSVASTFKLLNDLKEGTNDFIFLDLVELAIVIVQR